MTFRTLRVLTGAVLSALAVLAVLVGFAPALAQTDSPEFLVVHEVDATENPVELTVLSGTYDVGAEDITLIAEGEMVDAAGVSSALEAGDNVEIVFVIDANAKLSRANQFEATIEQVASHIEGLPDGVKVAVVAAGNRDQVQTALTGNLQSAARAVRSMNTSNGSAIFNGMLRGAELFSEDVDTHRTMIVTSAFDDGASVATPVAVRSELVRRNVQVLGARYEGDPGGTVGERRLGALTGVTGGALFDARNGVEFESALDLAMGIGSDRLIVSYEGQTELTERGDLTLQIGQSAISISYRGGRLTDKPLALEPVIDPPPSPLDFLRSGTGLAITVGLTAVGMLAAVWSLGNIFAGGESTLEGMLRRYSGEEEGAELDEEETALVQTALVKKAVELTESFAEDRGFLARVEEILEQGRIPLRAGEAMGIFGLITLTGFGLGFAFTGSFIRGLIVAAVAALATSSGVQFKARRRIKAFEAQLPDMLQLLAGTLRAGYSLPQGLEAVSHEIAEPMGYELTRAMTEARLGREIEEALEGVATRLDSPDFAWAVMAISIQREVGGNLNELLMTVSDTMVARERLAGEVRALTAEGKLSAAILGGLPPGLGFVMWIMNPSYIESLFTSSLGKGFIVAGVISGGIGLAWMRKIITINV
ncbi:MAG: type II secretion system F family protein [Acidimicrobiales bacterium]